MRILMSHRFFWPDTAPYALMLRQIAAHLVDAGHDVRVFSTYPSYRSSNTAEVRGQEHLDGIQVTRMRVFSDEKKHPLRRALNVLFYCLGLFWAILRQRPDIVTAATFPPVFAAWIASLGAKLVGARFIYHVQDIHPEVSKISGGKLGKGLPFQLLRWLDNQTLRRSHAIVVLSEDMADALRARGLTDLQIHIMNNFALEAFEDDEEPPLELHKPDGAKRVIFAGNLGKFQNLHLVADGVSLLFNEIPHLELVFLGDGTELSSLKEKWEGHPQVRFFPYLPFPQAKRLIEASDVGVASLTPEMYKYCYPSKILTYRSLNLPVLALVESDSKLARDIKEKEMGSTPDRMTKKAIARELRRLLSSVNPRAMPVPSTNKVLSQWSEIVFELGARRQK